MLLESVRALYDIFTERQSQTISALLSYFETALSRSDVNGFL